MARKIRDEIRENLSPDDVSECYSDYSDDMGQMARIKQRIATRFARFQGMGGEPKEIKAAYKLENMDNPADHIRGVIKTAQILRILPTEVQADGQISFIPALAQAPSAEAEAKVALARVRSDGYNSGRAGQPIDSCTFNAGTEEFVVWRDYWEDGAGDRAKAKAVKDAAKEKSGPANSEAAPTGIRPRGRPLGSKNKTTLAEAA